MSQPETSDQRAPQTTGEETGTRKEVDEESPVSCTTPRKKKEVDASSGTNLYHQSKTIVCDKPRAKEVPRTRVQTHKEHCKKPSAEGQVVL